MSVEKADQVFMRSISLNCRVPLCHASPQKHEPAYDKNGHGYPATVNILLPPHRTGHILLFSIGIVMAGRLLSIALCGR
jgi:hypothetical protein